MRTYSQCLRIVADVLRRHPLPVRPSDLPEGDRVRLDAYAAEHGVSPEHALAASRRRDEDAVELALWAEDVAREARAASH